MKFKRLRIDTTICNSKGVMENCMFEEKTVNWTIKEAKEKVMEMAMTFAPESKTKVYQSFSNDNFGFTHCRLYCYAVKVKNGNYIKEFTFDYLIELRQRL